MWNEETKETEGREEMTLPKEEAGEMKNEIEFKMGELMKDVTMEVKVKGMKVFKVRLWIGTLLIRAACWVIGCGAEIKMDTPEKITAEEARRVMG